MATDVINPGYLTYDGFLYDGREVSLIDSLPPVYQTIKDFKAMCEVCASELGELYYFGPIKILDDQYIETASSAVLGKWEKYLGITPNSTDTIEERKFRILAKLNDVPPYTDKYLVKRLDELCGKGNYRIYKDYDLYRLVVQVSLESMANNETVLHVVRDIIPANIELDVQEYRTRHSELTNYTHAELAAHTHDELKYSEKLS